ncbi:MAG: lysyl oxidase family protein [Solirubrobacteraceae bacterium]
MARAADIGAAAVISLPALLAVVAVSPASAHGAAALTSVGQQARWSGAISNNLAPVPAACTVLTCRSYELDLRLPGDAWNKPGGLLVSLRWPLEQLDAGYDLDLYLYGPDRQLVAQSDSIVYKTAEGLWLQDPRNGRYRIVVAPRDVIGTSPFELVASTKRGYSVKTTASLLGAGSALSGLTPYVSTLTFLGKRPATPTPMLPDLVPVKPGNFHIESTLAVSFYQATQRIPAHQPSCYPQETTGLDADEPGAQHSIPLRCLRWDMTVRNNGPGPLELRVYPNSSTPTDAYQVLYRSDGTYTLHRVGDATFSSAHGHVHFHGIDEVGLYTINADGSPGRLVATMPDKGICTLDLLNPSFGTSLDGPPRYTFPGTCDVPDNRDPADPLYPHEQYFRMGISAGWADIYPWFIPDQYIDITTVPDGRYLLVYRVNVTGKILEATRSNNSSSACVEIHRTKVATC